MKSDIKVHTPDFISRQFQKQMQLNSWFEYVLLLNWMESETKAFKNKMFFPVET